MDLQLTGKRALVTGSTKGLGEHIARTLAAEGAAVVVHGRDAKGADAVVDAITAAGGTAKAALGDLGDDDQAASVVDTALAAFGGIDILINCAGLALEYEWADGKASDWVALYNNNVGSQVRLIYPLSVGMRERGWGRVIAIGSVVGVCPPAALAAYGATKAALINMSVALAKEFAGTGVTANTVTPGTMLTPGVLDFATDAAKRFGWPETWEEMEPVFTETYAPNLTGGLGRPEHVAAFVAFVASPLSSYITGANLRVEGGYTPSVN